jgi:rubrerythrin
MSELHAFEVHGMTRSAFILRGALAVGAAYGGAAAGPYVAQALAQGNASDIAVLDFALALERLEAAFYAAALKTGKLSGEVKTLATEFAKHETTHVDTLNQLIQQLGGKASATTVGKVTIRNQADFLKAAVALEDLGVGAYNGAAPAIQTPDILSAAGSIVQTEARHAAALRYRAGLDPAPAAFDPGLTTAQVQAALKKLGR